MTHHQLVQRHRSTVALPQLASLLTLAIVLLLAPVAAVADEASVPVSGEWVERWRSDLAVLAEKIPARHPDPYKLIDSAEFKAELDRLSARLPEMAHHEVVVEVARIVARIGDGHTRLTLPLQEGSAIFLGHSKTPAAIAPGLRFGTLPLSLWQYSDGLHIRRIDQRHAWAAGLEVLRIGQLDTADAIAAVAPVVHHDNPSQLDDIVVGYLTVPEILHARGVISDLGTVTLVVETEDGEMRELVLEAGQPGPTGSEPPSSEPTASEPAPSQPISTQPVPTQPISTAPIPTAPIPTAPIQWTEAYEGVAPRYLARRDENYWFELLPESRTAYFQYNEVYNAEDQPIPEFADTLFGALDTGEIDRLIIDLRWNRGGDNGLNQTFVHGLIRSRKLREAGSLFVILGRGTFSAAMMFALDVERHTPVLFVGEPSGGRPNHFGDSRLLTLPETGVTVRISSLYWQYSTPHDERLWIEPHLPTPLSAADYRAGRDVAMHAILELVSTPIESPLGNWEGLAYFGGDPYDLRLSLSAGGGSETVTATLDIPQEGAVGIPLEEVSVEGDNARFVLPVDSRTRIQFSGRARGDRMILATTLGGRTAGFLMHRTGSR